MALYKGNCGGDKRVRRSSGAGWVAGLALLALGLAVVPAAGYPDPHTRALMKATSEAVDDARAAAESVVVVRLLKVETPKFSGRGRCRISAEVLTVERGTLHQPGQTIAFKVGCRRPYAPEDEKVYRATGQLPEGVRRQEAEAGSVPPPPLRPREFTLFPFLRLPPPLEPVEERFCYIGKLVTAKYARVFLDENGAPVFNQFIALEQPSDTRPDHSCGD